MSSRHIAEGEPVAIRPAMPADLPAVVALCRHWAAEKLTRNYRADTVEELHKRLGECFLVAEQAGQVMGFVIGEIKSTAGDEFVEGVLDDAPAYLEVQDLYVAPKCRQRGIGKALMRGVLESASQRGVNNSLVYSGNRDYARIAHFYEELGYEMWHIHMTRRGSSRFQGHDT